MARRMEGLISNFTGSLQWKLYGHKAAHYQFSQILFAFSWQLILSLDFIFAQVFKYMESCQNTTNQTYWGQATVGYAVANSPKMINNNDSILKLQK